jgi:CO/xanthine dehydrogenase FAD-binding subunit
MSLSQIRAFHRPNHMEQVWHLLQEGPEVRLVGGGSELAIRCPEEVEVLVDLAHLGLDTIEASDDGAISVGAMATLTDVMEHPAVRSLPSDVVGEMMVHVGSPLLRNAASIGGHLARGWLSDVIPVLLVLDATVEYFDGEYRQTTLEAYYVDGVHERLHVLTRVVIPPPTVGQHAAFLRFSRSTYDHALANAACRLDVSEGRATQVRLALSAGFRAATRQPAAEARLAGTPISEDDIAAAIDELEITAHSDWLASAEYRAHLAQTLARRCLRLARDRSGGAA